MKLSASNIGWSAEQDIGIYEQMHRLGFTGLEIAPTRWFSQQPYEMAAQAALQATAIRERYGLSICSMQSIWYGLTERIVQSPETRQYLLDYTEKALSFARAIGCDNFVFGCPKNRVVDRTEDTKIVIAFLSDVACAAQKHGVVVSLEANPAIYHTNFATTTATAFHIVETVNSSALRINLDFGTMVENKESLNLLCGRMDQIHHVHISEPFLRPIRLREEHRLLRKLLEENGYTGYVSLEMNNQCRPEELAQSISYLHEVFG